MMRAEGPIKAHSALEKRQRQDGWPHWEMHFPGGMGPGGLQNKTFVQIGASNGLSLGVKHGDPIYDYATKFNWAGIAIEPNPDTYLELAKNYKTYPVQALKLAVSDKDGTEKLKHNGGKPQKEVYDTIMLTSAEMSTFSKTVDVEALSIQSLWQQYVAKNFQHVDILAVDVEGAEPKVLQGVFQEPKPQFVLFDYNYLNTKDYQAIVTNLEDQGYEYVSRDGGDELHQRKKKRQAAHSKPTTKTSQTRTVHTSSHTTSHTESGPGKSL